MSNKYGRILRRFKIKFLEEEQGRGLPLNFSSLNKFIMVEIEVLICILCPPDVCMCNKYGRIL